jgi:DNA polymerase
LGRPDDQERTVTGQSHGDFETRSTVDLPKTGVHVYADAPDTDVWCFGWAIGDEAVEMWKPHDPGNIARLFEYLDMGGLFVAHNAAFELAIWNRLCVPRYGWPALPVQQVRCTMAMAYAMALPGSLEQAAAAVGLDIGKDMDGRSLMLRMSKPRSFAKDGSPIWWDDADRRERLYAYCRQDVEVERQLEKRLMPLSPAEQRLWELDMQVNDRGVQIDLPAVHAAMAVVEEQKRRLDAEMLRVTGGFVSGCTKVQDLVDWIDLNGVKTGGIAKADVLDLLGREDLPPVVRKALLLRQAAAKSSTAKLKSMVASAGADGRARGLLQFHGAATGRWAARRIQTQNMPRPTMDQVDIEAVLDILSGATP